MPIGKSAKKSLRQSQRNKQSNWSFKTKLKEIIKTFLAKPTEEGYKSAQSMLDKAQKNNILHRNKVARLKSNLVDKIGKEVVVTKTVKAKKKTKKVVKKAAKKM